MYLSQNIVIKVSWSNFRSKIKILCWIKISLMQVINLFILRETIIF